MKSKIIIFLLVLYCLMLLTGCVKHITDTNGEDNFTIQVYTDEDIISGNKSFVTFGSVENTIGNKTTKKINKFTGIYELDKIKVANQDLIYEIESTCNKGNFRIVITNGKEIIRDVNINQKEIIKLDNCSGTYSLIMVGESAKIKIIYTVSKG